MSIITKKSILNGVEFTFEQDTDNTEEFKVTVKQSNLNINDPADMALIGAHLGYALRGYELVRQTVNKSQNETI